MSHERRRKSMLQFAADAARVVGVWWRVLVWIAVIVALLSPLVALRHGILPELGSGLRRAAALGALAAFVFATLIERHPRGWRQRLLAALLVASTVAYATPRAAGVVLAHANSFYSASLLIEGSLVLLVVHGTGTALRAVAHASDAAAPMGADIIVHAMRVLLPTAWLLTDIGQIEAATVLMLLTVGFAGVAALLRAPSALVALSDRGEPPVNE